MSVLFPAKAPVAHRAVTTTPDGTTKPKPDHAAWIANPGGNYNYARIFVSATGTPTGCTVRAYLRSGGTIGQVGTGPSATLSGAPNYDTFMDVNVQGDDLLVFVETLTGGTTPTVNISVSWRN